MLLSTCTIIQNSMGHSSFSNTFNSLFSFYLTSISFISVPVKSWYLSTFSLCTSCYYSRSFISIVPVLLSLLFRTIICVKNHTMPLITFCVSLRVLIYHLFSGNVIIQFIPLFLNILHHVLNNSIYFYIIWFSITLFS
jgi:hypothetical protein